MRSSCGQVTETLKEVEMVIETGCDADGTGCTSLTAAVGDVIVSRWGAGPSKPIRCRRAHCAVL